MSGWSVVERVGSAGELHAAEPVWNDATILVMDVTAPAVVLGSTQLDDDIDQTAVLALGAEVARRRSGGGLVLLRPAAQVWFDVVMPRAHPAWDDDVLRAAGAIGHAVAASFRADGLDGLSVHEGPSVAKDSGRLICFAGIGAGEVLWRGRKLVGISQRRTRWGARFQCIVHRHFDADVHRALIRADRRTEDLDERLGAVADAALVDVAIHSRWFSLLADALPPG